MEHGNVLSENKFGTQFNVFLCKVQVSFISRVGVTRYSEEMCYTGGIIKAIL